MLQKTVRASLDHRRISIHIPHMTGFLVLLSFDDQYYVDKFMYTPTDPRSFVHGLLYNTPLIGAIIIAN